MDEEEKRSIGDYLGGALEGLGVGVGYVPHAMGSAILSGGEGLLSGFDWSDRPSWLFPGYARDDMSRKTSLNEGVEGVPFWSSEEAKEGFHRGIDRYSAPPQTPEGRDMAEWQNSLLTYADLPWELFGEGVEELGKRGGLSDDKAKTLGDVAYWGTSIGTGPIKAGASFAKKGVGGLSDKGQIYRKGWYNKFPGMERNPFAVLNTPVEMAREGFWQSLSPVEKAQYQYRGMSRMSQEAIDDSSDFIRSTNNAVNTAKARYVEEGMTPVEANKKAKQEFSDDIKTSNAMKRNIVGDYSNQYVQKVIYDPDNPAIQPGTPLYDVNKTIFPSQITTSAIEIKNNPEVISQALDLNVNPDVAGHISSRIPERFDRINDGKPVILAHRLEGADVTGNQMGQMAHSYKTNPKNGIGHAWSNLMDNNKPITAESLMAEINRINGSGSFDRKSPYPIPRKIKEENGYISYEYQVEAGPDPLTGSFDVIAVFNPRTGRITEMSIDRMALGGGMGKTIDELAEIGMKQHWVSITPWQSSVPGKYLEKHGLDNEALIALDVGVRGVQSANYPKGMSRQGKLTPKGREAKNIAIENVGEAMLSGKTPTAPRASDVTGMMPQNPLPFSLLPTGRPKFGIEHFFPQSNYPLVGTGLQERYKRDAY